LVTPLRLSIVIPSCRRPDLLERCLKSVCTYAPDGTQIIVVDDGSYDSIVTQTAQRFPIQQIIRHAKSLGFARAANAGIVRATGDIVEMLNDDAEVTPAWAVAALRPFENPNVVAVAPLVLIHPNGQSNHPRIDSAGDEYDPGGFARKRGHGKRLNESFLQPRPVWGVSASAGFYRRSALIQAGGFPSEFGAYFEDVDLSFRLRRNGGEIYYEPTSVVWHDVSASYGRRPNRRTLEMQSCNEERVYWRNTRGHDRWRTLPRHTVVFFGKFMKRLSEGTCLPWLTGRLRFACRA
jgi:GT2 family glycosyltransferase